MWSIVDGNLRPSQQSMILLGLFGDNPNSTNPHVGTSTLCCMYVYQVTSARDCFCFPLESRLALSFSHERTNNLLLEVDTGRCFK